MMSSVFGWRRAPALPWGMNPRSCGGGQVPALLDFNVHACRQVELHERVERLRRRLEDVQEPLVRADLELLARLLVDVRAAQNGELVDPGWERDGAGHLRAGPLRRLHDLAGRLIQQLVVVGLQPDPNLLSRHLREPRYWSGAARRYGARHSWRAPRRRSPGV